MVMLSDYIEEISKLRSVNALLWLFEIPLDDTWSLRVCRNTTNITWPTGGTGHIYYARDFKFGEIRTSTDEEPSGLGISSRAVTTKDREVFRLYDGFKNKSVYIRLVLANKLDLTEPAKEWQFRIASVSQKDDEGVTWKLGEFGDWDRPEPHRTFERDFCPFINGGRECLVNLSLPNVPRCDQTVDGKSGCRYIGEWMRKNGYPVRWPARTGAITTLSRDRQ